MLQLDHLVIAAASLAEGTAWCERVFGITPAEGGKHAFMGTHNLLFSVASAHFPNAYAEIIAIDPDGAAPTGARWFGLDEPAAQQALRGVPRLVHWVARSSDIRATSGIWRGVGIEPGTVVAAERSTPNGVLRWQISLRAGGARPFNGALPTLIEWGEAHPCDALPFSGVQLDRVQLIGLPNACLRALGSIDDVTHAGPASLASGSAPGPAPAEANPALIATLIGPRGTVTLSSRLTDPSP